MRVPPIPPRSKLLPETTRPLPLHCPPTEVSQLELSPLVDEQVLGLEVSVQDLPPVAIGQAPQQLEHEDLRGQKGLALSPGGTGTERPSDSQPYGRGRPLEAGDTLRRHPGQAHLHIVHIHQVPAVIEVLFEVVVLQREAPIGLSIPCAPLPARRGAAPTGTHQVLEDQGEGALRVDDVVQGDDVGVLEVLQQRHWWEKRWVWGSRTRAQCRWDIPESTRTEPARDPALFTRAVMRESPPHPHLPGWPCKVPLPRAPGGSPSAQRGFPSACCAP